MDVKMIATWGEGNEYTITSTLTLIIHDSNYISDEKTDDDSQEELETD